MDRAEQQEMFIALLAVVNKGCADKVATVNVEAVLLFVELMTVHYKHLDHLDSKSHKAEFGTHIQQIIDNLLIKIGEEKPMLKSKAIEALAITSFHPLIGAPM